MIAVVGETLHWGIDQAFQRHQRGEGARYEREALGLMVVTHATYLRRMPIVPFAKIALVSPRAGRTIKSTRRRLRAWHRDGPGGTVNSDRSAEQNCQDPRFSAPLAALHRVTRCRQRRISSATDDIFRMNCHF